MPDDTIKKEELNVKDAIYQVVFTEWEKSALIQIINNGKFLGTDIELVSKLKQKVFNAEKLKFEEPAKKE